ncbi:hypothetical protein GDO81_030028 [Engystomops pustulosus]|uniref:Uncharacterized protein n=1 Tax=Engystomops pustulosus TaxID=76066 RepID=A0AAV6YVI7_ENGPU|nr:hypothetical protein GDO81_030028 [Engystomops pustulosus]
MATHHMYNTTPRGFTLQIQVYCMIYHPHRLYSDIPACNLLDSKPCISARKLYDIENRRRKKNRRNRGIQIEFCNDLYVL